MKLDENGKTSQNKTFEYLTPIFRIFNDNFIPHIQKLSVLAYGIGDVFDKLNKIPSFYILIENKNNEDLSSFLTYIEDKEYYIKHYNHTKKLIIVVIQIPEIYHKSFYEFKKGNYSKMFSNEEINFFFNTKLRRNTYERLMKTDIGKKLYTERINKIFLTNVTEDIIEHHIEYDVPININIKQEIFNKKKNKQWD